MDQLWVWIAFHLFVLAMLAVDPLVFHKEAHEVSLREAASWSTSGVGAVFGADVYVRLGPEPKLRCLTVYPFEKAFSVENIVRLLLQRFVNSGARSAPCDLLRHSRGTGDARGDLSAGDFRKAVCR